MQRPGLRIIMAREISTRSSDLTSAAVERLEEHFARAQALVRDLEALEGRWQRRFHTGYLGSPGVRHLHAVLTHAVQALRRS